MRSDFAKKKVAVSPLHWSEPDVKFVPIDRILSDNGNELFQKVWILNITIQRVGAATGSIREVFK